MSARSKVCKCLHLHLNLDYHVMALCCSRCWLNTSNVHEAVVAPTDHLIIAKNVFRRRFPAKHASAVTERLAAAEASGSAGSSLCCHVCHSGNIRGMRALSAPPQCLLLRHLPP